MERPAWPSRVNRRGPWRFSVSDDVEDVALVSTGRDAIEDVTPHERRRASGSSPAPTTPGSPTRRGA